MILSTKLEQLVLPTSVYNALILTSLHVSMLTIQFSIHAF